MKSVDSWLAEYSATHQNAMNQRIHLICVPSIYWSVVAMVWSIPPAEFMLKTPYLNWSIFAMVLTLAFYLSLGWKSFFYMLTFSSLSWLICLGIVMADLPLLKIALIIFSTGWAFQFYGHYLEGKKPSFFKDLLFLLIGPLWVFKKF